MKPEIWVIDNLELKVENVGVNSDFVL
jgi:hypothetical protein